MFTLAHLSDPHIGPLPRVRGGELLNKRLFGYLSWRNHRKKIHRPEVLSRLQDDLARMAPDHVAITGDLTNIALPEEFRQVRIWLEKLGPAKEITVIPGNHDAYVSLPWRDSIGHWANFISSDADKEISKSHTISARFPTIRVRDEVALIGLSTARATSLFLATGLVGIEQRRRLAEVLKELGEKQLCRVVMLHHPPCSDKISWRKRLVDADKLCLVIEECGAELILHGHDHKFTLATINTKIGNAAVFGVPSASALADGARPQSHYHLYNIDRISQGWNVGVRVRQYDERHHNFTESKSYSVKLAR